jgi:hypothetical protein
MESVAVYAPEFSIITKGSPAAARQFQQGDRKKFTRIGRYSVPNRSSSGPFRPASFRVVFGNGKFDTGSADMARCRH